MTKTRLLAALVMGPTAILAVLLLVVHGPLATNILNIYTCAVSTQALDIHINRRVLNLVIGVVAMGAVVFFVLNGEFAKTLDAWLVGIIGWLAPWAAVMLVHWFGVARGRVDAATLLAPPGESTLPPVRVTALLALALGIAATWLFMYGMVPVMQGPVATALGGVDLSWLAGGLTAGLVYAALELPKARRVDA